MAELSNPMAERAADAIIALINSSPRTPSRADIAAVLQHSRCATLYAESPFAADLRAAIAAEKAAEEACFKLCDGPALDAGEAIYEQRHAEALALAKRIPSPPRTFGDIVLSAEYALHWAEFGLDGRMRELESDDMFLWSAARLIKAVLAFGEVRHHG